MIASITRTGQQLLDERAVRNDAYSGVPSLRSPPAVITAPARRDVEARE
jgi:hypothetical protein